MRRQPKNIEDKKNTVYLQGEKPPANSWVEDKCYTSTQIQSLSYEKSLLWLINYITIIKIVFLIYAKFSISNDFCLYAVSCFPL